MIYLRTFLFLLLLCSACTAHLPEVAPVASSSPPVTSPTQAPSVMPVPNLIQNGDVEAQSTLQEPAAWTSDHWGDNRASLALKTTDAVQGTAYLSRQLQDYTAGDAKWIFDPVTLSANQWYEYSDTYRADGRNRLIIACQDTEGKRFFHTLWQTHAQPQWGKESFRFYGAPYAGCQASVMHVLDRNGYLDTDQHQLQPVAAQPLKRPLVSISFDDIWKTVITEGLKPLNDRGWKGSFYITRRFAELSTHPEYAKRTDI